MKATTDLHYSGRSEFVDMWQVAGSHRANSLPVDCDESDRVAVESYKFDFERLAFPMHQHHGAYIAMLQALLRHVLSQDHRIQFIDFFHSLREKMFLLLLPGADLFSGQVVHGLKVTA